MTPQEMIDVLQAYKDGQILEYQQKTNSPALNKQWMICSRNPAWNFDIYNYRIKKEQQKEFYKYLIKNYTHNSNTIYYYDSPQYFSSIEKAKEFYNHHESKVIKRLDYTKLIVEE